QIDCNQPHLYRVINNRSKTRSLHLFCDITHTCLCKNGNNHTHSLTYIHIQTHSHTHTHTHTHTQTHTHTHTHTHTQLYSTVSRLRPIFLHTATVVCHY